MTLSGAATTSQSGPGSDGNEGVLCIPQSSSITGALPSDFFMSYPGHLLGEGVTSLQRCSWCILQPQPTGLKMKREKKNYIFSRIGQLQLFTTSFIRKLLRKLLRRDRVFPTAFFFSLINCSLP